jgi:hypothetical protein
MERLSVPGCKQAIQCAKHACGWLKRGWWGEFKVEHEIEQQLAANDTALRPVQKVLARRA